MTTKKITRRTFLGSTAVGAATTSLSFNAWAQAVNNQKSPLINGTIPALEDGVKVVNTYHEIHCHGQCMLKAHVKDGKLLALTSAGDIPSKDCLPSDESIGKMQRRACMKGYAERKRLYAPDRLKYPLIQTIERGNTAGFKRVSWDEALDRACEAIRKMQDRQKELGYLPIWNNGCAELQNHHCLVSGSSNHISALTFHHDKSKRERYSDCRD